MLGLFEVTAIATTLQIVGTVVLYYVSPIACGQLFENMLTASTHQVQRLAGVHVLLLLLLLVFVDAGHVLLANLMFRFQMGHQLVRTLEYAQAVEADVLFVHFPHVLEEVPVLVVGSTRRAEEHLLFVFLLILCWLRGWSRSRWQLRLWLGLLM